MFDVAPAGSLSQGDLVSGLSAHGYEPAQTYGLVITARCDFEHGKADLINYVPIVPLKHWFDQLGWRRSASQEERQSSNQLKTEAEKCLKRTEIEKSAIDVAVDEYGGAATINLIQSSSAKISDRATALAERLDLLRSCLSADQRAPTIREDLVQTLLNDLQAHKLSDLYYLPLDFLSRDESERAHVALLREIYSIRTTSLDPASGVAGIRLREADTSPRPPLSACPIVPFGRVARMKSPYTEHFLQRVTLLFSRVGVDDVRFANLKRLAEVIR